jgi:MGT family glycosyltransferase
MARFCFTCWPFVGHLYPQIGLAKRLASRGHDVAFYTGANAVPVLGEEGLSVFPFRRVDERRVYELVTAVEAGTPTSGRTHGAEIRAFRDWIGGTVPDQVADLRDVIASWRPDVIVTDLSMWGPILVLWETTGIPVAISSTLLGPLVPGPDAPPPGPGLPPPRGPWTRLLARAVAVGTDVLAAGMRRRVDRLRASHGLPPLGCSVNAFTARLPLYLVPSVPELDFDRRDLPDCVHYVGACTWNKPSRAVAPDWLDGLPDDRPWVHVTEGTLHYQDPFVLRAAARGLADRHMHVILTTGPQRDPAAVDLGPLATNIRVEQWVSHADLLPRCAVLVTTGGAATVLAALQAGVPMVVVPTTWDKPDNARRVVDAGAGVRLSPRRCTPGSLRDAVEQVLAEPRYRQNARRLARSLGASPGPRRACELLEGLASPVATPVSVG